MRRFAWLIGVCLVILVGCSKKPAPDAHVELPEAPPPAALLATLSFSSPNVAWAKIQKSGGPGLGLLPMTVGGLLGTLGHLEPGLANEIDGTSPAFGVVVGPLEVPRFAFALKVVELRKARALLLDGDTARYSSREAEGVTHLVPRGGVNPAFASALSQDGYFLVGKTSEDISELAPYLTRTLARRPAPAHALTIDLPKSALGGALRERLSGAWTHFRDDISAADERERKAHQGRAPDFGDPQAILSAVDAVAVRALALLQELDRLRVVLDVDDDRVSAEVVFTPTSGGSGASGGAVATLVSELPGGEVDPLFDLPANASLAFVLRARAGKSSDGADDAEKLLTAVLGARLSAPDAARVHTALEGFAKGRDELVRGALFASSSDNRLYVRTRAVDAENLSGAARSVAELLGAAPFRDALRTKKVSFSASDAPPFGKLTQASITGGDDKPKWSLAWGVRDGDFHWFAADDTTAFVESALSAPKLRADPAFVRDVGTIAKHNPAFVMAFQPSHIRFFRSTAAIPPAVITWGREDQSAVLRFSLPSLVAREAARRAL